MVKMIDLEEDLAMSIWEIARDHDEGITAPLANVIARELMAQGIRLVRVRPKPVPRIRPRGALNPYEAADLAGVDRRTIYRWMDRGLPYMKMGRYTWFNKKELEAWVGRINHAYPPTS